MFIDQIKGTDPVNKTAKYKMILPATVAMKFMWEYTLNYNFNTSLPSKIVFITKMFASMYKQGYNCIFMLQQRSEWTIVHSVMFLDSIFLSISSKISNTLQ